jgi:hypothetical protein
MLDLKQFIELRKKLTAFTAVEGNKVFLSSLYGVENCACDDKFRKMGILYSFVFYDYQMNIDGSTTGLINRMSEEDFNNVVLSVKRLVTEINNGRF